MKHFTFQSIALHLLAAGLLSACTVAVVDTPRPVGPRACTFEHAPVCGQRGDRQRTFSNACLARAEGFRVVSRGQCRRPAPLRPPQSTACSRQFAPVCALRGNRRQTFSNSCMARAQGFRPVHQGRCR